MELFNEASTAEPELLPILERWAVCIRRADGQLELLPAGLFDVKAHALDYGRRCGNWYRLTTPLVVPVSIDTARGEVVATVEG